MAKQKHEYTPLHPSINEPIAYADISSPGRPGRGLITDENRRWYEMDADGKPWPPADKKLAYHFKRHRNEMG